MKPLEIMRFGRNHFWDRCNASLGTPACIILLVSLFPAITQAQDSLFRDEIRSFKLDHAVAVAVAEILTEQFQLQKNGFSANKTTNTIYVRIPDEMVPEVQNFIDRLEADAAKAYEETRARTDEMNAIAAQRSSQRELTLQIYALQHVGAEELLAVIGELGFQNAQLSIAAESRSNSIVARGDAGSLKELEMLLMNLDKPGEAGSTTPRFDSVELAKLRREYQTLLSQFGGTHPKVVQLKQRVESLEQLERYSDLAPVRKRPVKSESQLQKEYEAAEQTAARIANQWQSENDKGDRDKERLEMLRAQLTKQVQAAFQLRQQIKKFQIDRAAEQLQNVRSRLEQRDQIAEQIVSRRVEDLLSADNLQWLSSDSGSVEKPSTESSESSAPNDSITSRPVQIQALDQGVIVLRGKKSDVDMIVKTLHEVQESNQSVQNVPTPQGVVKWFDPFADGDEVVVSVGGDDGIKHGDLLSVRRDGKMIGRLQVVRVTADEANARILTEAGPIKNGDEIFQVEEPAVASGDASAADDATDQSDDPE